MFLDSLNALYGGTRLAAQELEGLIVEDLDAALWRAEDLARCRGAPPSRFERVAIRAALDFDADAIVAESNQGGDMVRSTLATRDPPCAVRLVHASKGKRTRAEPVAALYEQGRVVHCGAFAALEEELMALGSDDLAHSPDRADALVWALSELMLGRGKQPRLRAL